MRLPKKKIYRKKKKKKVFNTPTGARTRVWIQHVSGCVEKKKKEDILTQFGFIVQLDISLLFREAVCLFYDQLTNRPRKRDPLESGHVCSIKISTFYSIASCSYCCDTFWTICNIAFGTFS